MQRNLLRMYYKIGELSGYDTRDASKDKPVTRRLARRRLARELRRDPEGA